MMITGYVLIANLLEQRAVNQSPHLIPRHQLLGMRIEEDLFQQVIELKGRVVVPEKRRRGDQ
jgi:hypothetical protein